MDTAVSTTDLEDGIAVATLRETARATALVLAPQIAQGMILRRPGVLRPVERGRVDARAGAVLAGLHRRYGGRPVRLRLPGRRVVLVTDPDDAEEILARGPDPFTPAAREKCAALQHFEPGAVLISDAEQRRVRRSMNEMALATGKALHPCAAHVATIATAEAARLLGAAEYRDLAWSDWEKAWWRIVRSVVLGTSAADEEETTNLLRRLRRRANWAYLAPRRGEEQAKFAERLQQYAVRGEAGSLLGHLAESCPAAEPAETGAQAAHWLFAFDAAGIAAFRVLALIAARPGVAERVRSELPGHPATESGEVAELPYLRAVVEDSLRLYPTTLSILRETTGPASWGDRRLPAGTLLVLPSSFLHRSGAHPRVGEAADRLAPQLWLDGGRPPGVIPFSAGPASCAGRDVVLLTTSQVIAAVLRDGEVTQTAGPSLRTDPLPPTLDHAGLRVRVARFSGGPA
jgi:cytochrome P450